jgi:hypothetical protein
MRGSLRPMRHARGPRLRVTMTMPARLTRLAVLVCVGTVGPLSAQNRYPKLADLYANKQFFDLRDALQEHRGDASKELEFYRAIVAAAFNRPQSAIGHAEKYLAQVDIDKDPRRVQCFTMLADSHLKTIQYKKAAEAYRTVFAKFRDEVETIAGIRPVWG